MISLKLTRRLSRHLRTAVKGYSTEIQPVSKTEKEEEYEKQIKDFQTLKNIQRRQREKKPQRPPFAKNLFIGDFDTDILTYPELTKEEVDNLQSRLPTIEQLVDLPHMRDVASLSNKNFRQNLSDYQCIGLQASQFMNGLECTYGETFRILEALCKHPLRDGILQNEILGAQTLVKFGDQVLKTKYLDPVMRGEKLTAFCMTEHELTDLTSITTKAEQSSDKKKWILNGEKAWVLNGLSSDYLIVFAVTQLRMTEVIKDVKLTAFLVDKEFGGVSCTKKDNSLEICDIKFDNTEIPTSNVIGEVDKGDEILKGILTEFRLGSAVPCLSLTRKLINNLEKYVVNKSSKENSLYETDAIREKFGELIVNLYTMESMVYLTTGLLDNYQNQDVELESAIVKVFCSEILMSSMRKCLDIIGYPAIESSHWSRELFDQSLNYVTTLEANSNLKLVVSLLGLQHAGEKLEEKIVKLRNPLYHASFILKRMITNNRNKEDNPKLDLRLGEYLHPSCLPAAQTLEYCVKRLEFATEIVLSRYGLDVMNRHMDLRRMAEIIIDIYAMVAVLGRSSRAYCIGLQHGDLEMVLANTFCAFAKERVRENVKQIYHGQFITMDENYRIVSKRLIKFKGYFPVSPLIRSY